MAKERGSGGLWHELLTLYKKQEEADTKNLVQNMSGIDVDLWIKYLISRSEIERALEEESSNSTSKNRLLIEIQKMKDYCKILLYQCKDFVKNVDKVTVEFDALNKNI